MAKTRRRFTAEQKAAILREHLVDQLGGGLDNLDTPSMFSSKLALVAGRSIWKTSGKRA